MEQMVFEQVIETSWEETTLGKLCEIVSGNTPKGLDQISNSGIIPFYRVSDMNHEGNEVFMTRASVNLNNDEVKKLRLKLYPKGTIIFPKRGGAILTNKKRVLSDWATFDLNVMGVVPNEKVESAFLYYWFLKLDLSKIYDGSNVPQINIKNVAPLRFTLPTIEVQHQIVSKIEELFSELDKGFEELKTAQQQLKVYRQAVLKWAFEGKLTNENVKDGELPEGWKYLTLEEVGDKKYPFSYGVLKPGENVKNGVPIIKSQHTRNLYILENIEDKISDDLDRDFKRTKIKGGEILLNLVGASIGRCAIAPMRLKGANVSRAVAVLTIDSQYSSTYLLYFLADFFSEKKIKSICGGSAQPVLNLSTVRKIIVPIPPIGEEHQIVQEIESRLSVCDNIEETITVSLKQAEALRQSILKKAYEGNILEKL